jgi:hypothetical protein
VPKSAMKQVRQMVVKKLDVSSSRISQRIKDIKNERGPMTSEYALYVLAHEEGLDISKLLDHDVQEKLRQITIGSQVMSKATASAGKARKSRAKPRLNIDPILSEKTMSEAKKMAEEVYPLLYIFENSVRELILRMMKRAFGSEWWDTKVQREIRDYAEDRKKKEKDNPWHSKRGAHPIYYTNMDHLKRIITNNWYVFEKIFPKIEWLHRLDETIMSRNTIAHNNPLHRDDIDRIKVYYRDWKKLMIAKKILIPPE